MSERFGWLEFAEETPEAQPTSAMQPDAAALMQKGRKAYLEGEFESALRSYSAALKHDKGQEEAWAFQVRCLLGMNELREARTWAEKAQKLLPNSVLVASVLALTLSHSGLEEGALASSDRALEMSEGKNFQSPSIWLDRGSCLLAAGRDKTAMICYEKLLEMVNEDPDWLQMIGQECLECQRYPQAASYIEKALEKRRDRAYLWYLKARAARALGEKAAALRALDQVDSLQKNYAPAAELRRAMKRACWVAGLVFRPGAPEIAVLRRWRDEAWLSHRTGRLLSELYDRTAPAVCGCLAYRPGLMRITRYLLSLLVRKLQRRRVHGQETRP